MSFKKLASLILGLGIYMLQANPLADLALRHEGRIKPFESFAKAQLLQFSGKESVRFKDSSSQKDSSLSAVDWMAWTLFNPQKVQTLPVFLINDPQIAIQFGLEPKESRKYSIKELAQHSFKIDTLASEAEQVDARKRSAEQAEYIRVRDNLHAYKELSASQSIFRPHADFYLGAQLASECGLQPGIQSMYQVLQHIGPIAQRLELLGSKAQADWDSTDLNVMSLTRSIYEWSQQTPSGGPQVFGIQKDWLSAGQLIQKQLISKEEWSKPIDAWSELALSYQGNQPNNSPALKMEEWNLAQAGNLNLRPKAIAVEQFYNHLKPLRWALILCIFASLGLLGYLLVQKKIWLHLSFGLSLPALLLLCIAIGSRMFITQRPPVTNLYETFLFVGAVIGLCGLILDRFGHRLNGNLLLSLGMGSLIWLSGRFAIDGDTMKVLQAVLDSNFWLSTHVVTISLGYAGVVAAGLAGHALLIQRILKSSEQSQKSTWLSMHALLGFGLIMSLVGTVLGGVWADQSWGRFWGWDPKENGALLIVLWCAILYHAKLAGWLGRIGMAVGNSIGILVVMLAWFGINLLGVGLHSYGFTQGAELRFLLYLGIHGSIIGLLSYLAWRQAK